MTTLQFLGAFIFLILAVELSRWLQWCVAEGRRLDLVQKDHE